MDLRALHKLSYGMYLLTVESNGRRNGQIVNAVIQVTSEPPQVAICINKANYTYSFLNKSNFFALSILSENTPLSFIGNWGFKSGREVDKFLHANVIYTSTGTPVVTDYAIATMELELVQKVNVGTHDVFIGKILSSNVLSQDTPMTYAYYHHVKGGGVPKSAPHYAGNSEEPIINGDNNLNTDKPLSGDEMKKYQCTVCGYVYDPVTGDPDSGIAPGTAFEDIPDDWTCPVCGVEKSMFQPV